MSTEQSSDPRVRRTYADISRATAELLLEHGWDHVTHAHVAEHAGYSRATIYKHWPNQHDLLRAAFLHMGSMPHGERTGDLREDLISELEAYRRVLVDARFARAVAALAERAAANPEIAAVRDDFLGGGQAKTRQRILEALRASGREADVNVTAAADMLSGALTWRTAIMGESTDLDYVRAVVDVFLRGLENA